MPILSSRCAPKNPLLPQPYDHTCRPPATRIDTAHSGLPNLRRPGPVCIQQPLAAFLQRTLQAH